MASNLKQKALDLGATDFGVSKIPNKRFYVIFNNKKIHFASKTGKTFIDHGNNQIKNAWLARHTKIRNKQGQLVHKLKTSPSYWSKILLWS